MQLTLEYVITDAMDVTEKKSFMMKKCVCAQSCQLFATPWTVARQAPLSMEFSRPKILEWVAFPPPGDHLKSGIEPATPALAGRFFTS